MRDDIVPLPSLVASDAGRTSDVGDTTSLAHDASQTGRTVDTELSMRAIEALEGSGLDRNFYTNSSIERVMARVQSHLDGGELSLDDVVRNEPADGEDAIETFKKIFKDIDAPGELIVQCMQEEAALYKKELAKGLTRKELRAELADWHSEWNTGYDRAHSSWKEMVYKDFKLSLFATKLYFRFGGVRRDQQQRLSDVFGPEVYDIKTAARTHSVIIAIFYGCIASSLGTFTQMSTVSGLGLGMLIGGLEYLCRKTKNGYRPSFFGMIDQYYTGRKAENAPDLPKIGFTGHPYDRLIARFACRRDKRYDKEAVLKE